jgi:hypothetical protein
MISMITNQTSLEEDTEFLQALLTNLTISHHKFRKLVVDVESHGQQCGLPIRGSAYLNEYRKANKRYKYNYEKANKKYFDQHGAYSLVASWREDITTKGE